LNRSLFVGSLLALSLAAPALLRAQPAAAPASAPAAAAAPAVEAVNPGAIQALKDMGAFLQTLKRYHVATELTGEVVLEDGQKLQHTAKADIDVARPNMLRARMFSARSEREIYFNGKLATIFLPAQKDYSTVELAGTNTDLVTRLKERYGVELPLSDLFLWGTPDAPLDKIDSAMNAGQDFIGKDLCNHFAFRQGDYDWQIWIAADGKPLPRKLVIINRADDARPQSVSTIDWNLSPGFDNAVFTFVPPKGATRVQLHALDGK
jgi:hypothetical protein